MSSRKERYDIGDIERYLRQFASGDGEDPLKLRAKYLYSPHCPPFERAVILDAVLALCNDIPRLGPIGAVEILYAIGRKL